MAKDTVYNAAKSTLTGDRVHVYASPAFAENDPESFDFSDVDPVAFGTSCSIEISADTIDSSNKMGGNWKNTRVGQLGWTASIEALYSTDEQHLSFDKLLAAAANREVIGVAFGIVAKTEEEFAQAKAAGFHLDSTDPTLAKGRAYITQISANFGTGGEVASYSVQLTGDGRLIPGGTAAPAAATTSES